MFAHFEEGNIFTETRNNTESGDESDSESLMMIKQDMKNIDSNEKSNHDNISTDMLEEICDRSQTNPTVNKREARCKIRYRINQRQLEWKGPLKATRNMVKGLHKVFSTIVLEILQELTNLGESSSEVSHFIPEPRNFAEVKKLSENIRKPWLKATLKEIKNIINNKTLLIEDRKEGEPVTQ